MGLNKWMWEVYHTTDHYFVYIRTGPDILAISSYGYKTKPDWAYDEEWDWEFPNHYMLFGRRLGKSWGVTMQLVKTAWERGYYDDTDDSGGTLHTNCTDDDED